MTAAAQPLASRVLGPADFPEFFEALHGVPPFPWQAELARRACEGRWPAALDLPTAAGKTAALDVAVFALALEADRAAGRARVAAMRTFFVVDRRIVIDGAAIRARKIASRLRSALGDPGASPVLAAVARNLVRLSGRTPEEVAPGRPGPLTVAVLRGGIYRDERWAESAAQPTLALATVDQIGSRLLFRGYGLGRSGRVIHAGLAGSDSRILLDEAHLSRPFLDTLMMLAHHRRPEGVARGPGMSELPFGVTTMSATIEAGPAPLTLTDADRRCPALAARLRASKRAELVEVPTSRDDEEGDRRVFANRIAEGALGLADAVATATAPGERLLWFEPAPAPVVGVVVNRVDTARRAFERLRALTGGRADVILLTGRIRPIDRDRLLDAWMGRMRAGRDRDRAGDRPLFVVATQTIEVGADLDFDALVCEAAPLDALRQRLGRLDRLGRLGSSRVLILARRDSVAAQADDPVYGRATAATWAWLTARAGPPKKTRGSASRGTLDLGIDALAALLVEDPPADLAALNSPRPRAPALLPAHLDAWVQTDPFPVPDPDIAPFLHGPARTADLLVVWRSDLPELAAAVEGGDRELARRCAGILALVPPSGLEAMPVPVPAARAWLDGGSVADVADLEGPPAGPPPAGRRAGEPAPRRAIRWRGPGDCEVVTADRLRPGDTVVVPGEYGGSDEFGWLPGSGRPVPDLGDHASLKGRGRPTLRVHPAMLDGWIGSAALDPEVRTLLDAARAGLARPGDPGDDDEADGPGGDDPLAAIRGLIGGWPDLPAWVATTCAALDRGFRVVPYPGPEADGRFVLIARETVRPPDNDEPAEEGEAEDAGPPTEVGPVGLADHLAGVADLAVAMARAIGLPESLVADLGLAGGLHDVGKADPRFQLRLHGGDEIARATAEAPLAKSARPPVPGDVDRSGYPRGGRHEALSVALAMSHPGALAGAGDRDLVLHLGGVHHGRGRPFWPVVPDPENPAVTYTHRGFVLRHEARHGLERLDRGWTDQFWRVARRYGPWGLALLEATLMLADHRRSRDEEEGRA